MNRLCRDPLMVEHVAFQMFLTRHESSFEAGYRTGDKNVFFVVVPFEDVGAR